MTISLRCRISVFRVAEQLLVLFQLPLVPVIHRRTFQHQPFRVVRAWWSSSMRGGFCAFTHSLLSMSTQCLCRAMESPIRRPSSLKQEVFLVVSRENYHHSSQANTLTRKHLPSSRVLPVALVEEAAVRRRAGSCKHRQRDREHWQH